MRVTSSDMEIQQVDIFRVLIPRICVIQALRGAFVFDCNLKPRFHAIVYNTILMGYTRKTVLSR